MTEWHTNKCRLAVLRAALVTRDTSTPERGELNKVSSVFSCQSIVNQCDAVLQPTSRFQQMFQSEYQYGVHCRYAGSKSPDCDTIISKSVVVQLP